MRGLSRHQEFSASTAIGNAVGRPHTLVIESGITSASGGTYTVFDVNTSATYHSMRTDDSIDFYFGTGDFTLECWINIVPGANPISDAKLFAVQGIDTVGGVDIAVTKYYLMDWTGSNIGFYKDAGAEYTTRSYTAGNWVHLAVSRQNGTETFFVDGTIIDYDTGNENYTGTHISIGGDFGQQDSVPDDFQVRFLLDDIRITKNQALYTVNFSPIPRQTIYNTANTMAFFSSYSTADDTTTGPQEVVIAPGYAPAGYVSIDL